MRLSRSWLSSALCIGLVFSAGCGSSGQRAHSADPEPLHLRRIEVLKADDRPLLGLMSRRGDPAAALSIAAAHDLGAEASIALGALLAERLIERGVADAESHVHTLGFQTAVLVNSADGAERFVRAAAAALATPLTDDDAALHAVRGRLRNVSLRAFASEADANVAACSAELGVAKVGARRLAASDIEGWRKQVHRAGAVAISAIGDTPILDATRDALEKLEAWPDGDGPEDPWPARDTIGASANDAERSLSVALRVPGAGSALTAARVIGGDTSELSLRLSALEPPWSVERVTAVARPRGACLRMDAAPPRGDPGPRPGDAARATLVLLEEAERALAGAADSAWAVDESVIGAHDPRHAANILAWRVLSGRLEPGEPRRAVHLTAKARELGEPASGAFAEELRRVREQWQTPRLERRQRIEAGQGEIWILLASPCGARGESELSAGLTATVLHALAARTAHAPDLAIEPWTTADGAGLLVHGSARGAEEGARAHAQRLAAALGKTLVTQRLSGQEVALARSTLLDGIGPDPAPGYWLAVRTLAPGRPSLLEPRGTWAALSEAATLDAEAQRRVLLQGPWRVAVLANSDEEQVRAAAAELERWLRPVRVRGSQCAEPRPPLPRSGELTIEATGDTKGSPNAYVAVPLASSASGPSREALLTQWLLNQPRGWLAQALRVPGLAGAARARLLGGAGASALVIEIHALEGRAHEAVAQVRGLLERLGRGAATEQDLQLAERALLKAELHRNLDPRRRVVELWRGASESRAATLASLRRMHQRAFSAASHVVVHVKPRA